MMRLVPVMMLVAVAWGTALAQNPEFQFSDSYRIGVDDKITVNVWRNSDLTISVPVRPDGMISVPLVGDVLAGGRTPTAVAAEITEKLKEYIRNPNVTVIVTELNSHEFLSRVRVTGAVATPGSMAHRQGMTVLDAVLEVGGVNEFANADKTKVYRKAGGKEEPEVISVQLGRILKKGDLSTNIDLRPGDIVTVPERFF